MKLSITLHVIVTEVVFQINIFSVLRISMELHIAKFVWFSFM